MNLHHTFRLSITAILTNRLRSCLTILGIVIGVSSIILLVSLVVGLKSYVTNQIAGLGSNLLFVVPGRVGGSKNPGEQTVNKLTLSDATFLKERLEGKAEVSAVIERDSDLTSGNRSDQGTTVFGIQSNYPQLINIKIAQGRFFDTSEISADKKMVVIGAAVKQDLFGLHNPVGQKLEIEGLRYTVIGVAASRGSTFGVNQDNTVLAPVGAISNQFGFNNINTIYVSANQAQTVNETQTAITTILKKRLSEGDFSVLTQEQTLQTINSITRVLTLILGGITTISLVVGGIGVMNIMLVSVTERTREIGLRKALGARPKDIRNQFLTEAVTLSGLGGVVGVFLGSVLTLMAGQLITTTLSLWSILLSFGFSMLVGVLFGVLPALRASHLSPLAALKYE